MQSKPISLRKQRIFIGVVFLVGVVCVLGPSVKRAAWELYLSADVYEAIKAGDAVQVEALLQKGANPNRDGAGGLMGGTPLMWATQNSDLKIMKVLLKNGANVDQKTSGGYTALMQARSPEAAQLLMNSGADPYLMNDRGEDANQCAKRNYLPRVAKVIENMQTNP